LGITDLHGGSFPRSRLARDVLLYQEVRSCGQILSLVHGEFGQRASLRRRIGSSLQIAEWMGFCWRRAGVNRIQIEVLPPAGEIPAGSCCPPLSFRSVLSQARRVAMSIAGPPSRWQYRSNISGSVSLPSVSRMAPDCFLMRILSGGKMTDQIGRTGHGSVSLIETLSVAAVLLILVMIAIPIPYTSQNHGFPALPTALGRRYVAADSRSGDTLKSRGGANAGSVGYAPQGSPFEVRTVGQREFCPDMPGVVRFSANGGRCKTRLPANPQPPRVQLRP
jgi:hypothetical protein